MATFDLRLKMYIAGALLGVAMVVVATIGELLGWWNDFGVVLGFLGIVVTVALGLLASSRFQVRELGSEIRGVSRGVDRLQGSSDRIEANTHRIEANTSEAVTLLREIRDRLPAPER